MFLQFAGILNSITTSGELLDTSAAQVFLEMRFPLTQLRVHFQAYLLFISCVLCLQRNTKKYAKFDSVLSSADLEHLGFAVRDEDCLSEAS